MTAAATTSDARIYLKKMWRSGFSGSETAAIIIQDNEMKNIMKIVNTLEDSGLLTGNKRAGDRVIRVEHCF